MADRALNNWINAYLNWTEDTEPAKIFHKWTALYVISSALRKKIRLSLGRLSVYPNLYIVFVAEPGVARKSQAIRFGEQIMSEIPDIIVSADSTTREALLDDLESALSEEQMPDGTTLRHCSLNVISKEFESFLGQKKENTKLLVLLTDLFDCQELPWKYRTKHSGSNVIPSVFFNMLAATTPDSLASSLPSSAIGGGLTSRIMCVWADKLYKKCTRPEETKAIIELKKKLVDDLFKISRMAGTIEFSPECFSKWDNWYSNYNEISPTRLCDDPSFNAWYSRKPMYILKIAIICSAAKSSSLILEWEAIEQSFELVHNIEKDMGKVFSSIGKSLITSEVDLVMQIIKNKKFITEKNLLSMVWRDIDSNKFDNVIQTAMRTGKVMRGYLGPEGQKGAIWYYDTIWYKTIMEKDNESKN